MPPASLLPQRRQFPGHPVARCQQGGEASGPGGPAPCGLDLGAPGAPGLFYPQPHLGAQRGPVGAHPLAALVGPPDMGLRVPRSQVLGGVPCGHGTWHGSMGGPCPHDGPPRRCGAQDRAPPMPRLLAGGGGPALRGQLPLETPFLLGRAYPVHTELHMRLNMFCSR